MGIEILPPDVNESDFKFTVIGDKRIRFGLGAVRNVGRAAIDSILAARADGAVHVAVRLLRAGRPAPLQQARVRSADPERRAATPSAATARSCIAALDAAISEAGAQAGGGQHRAGIAVRRPRTGSRRPSTGSREARPDPAQHPGLVGLGAAARRRRTILGFYISGHPLEPFRTECELFATHTVSPAAGLERRTRWPSASWSPPIKRQISKKLGQRVRPIDSRGLLRLCRGPSIPGGVGGAGGPDQDRCSGADQGRVLAGGTRTTRSRRSSSMTVTPLAERRTNGAVIVALQLAVECRADPRRDGGHSGGGREPSRDGTTGSELERRARRLVSLPFAYADHGGRWGRSDRIARLAGARASPARPRQLSAQETYDPWQQLQHSSSNDRSPNSNSGSTISSGWPVTHRSASRSRSSRSRSA